LPTASLAWLDLTAGARDKVRRVLDLFNERGTVDELGLGSVRDTISNALSIRWVYWEIGSRLASVAAMAA